MSCCRSASWDGSRASGMRSALPPTEASRRGVNRIGYAVGSTDFLSGAVEALEEAFVPVDAAIVGLIDEVDVVRERGLSFVRGRDDLPGSAR